jgi:bifunctional non-homologous end joining protein LigD
MQATLCDKAFSNRDWIFELKFDGYRIIAFKKGRDVKLQTRNLKDYTHKYPHIVAAIKKWKFDAVVDGEIVVLAETGKSDFAALEKWRNLREHGPLYFYIFDLLWYNGTDCMNMELIRRKIFLKDILPKNEFLHYTDHITPYGEALFRMTKNEGLEGIVAKKKSSKYIAGTRSKDWLKIKTFKEDDFVVAGYTRQFGSGNLFDSLILGAYKGKTLQCIGEVYAGLRDRDQREIAKMMKIIKKCPFPQVPRLSMKWGRKKPDLINWCRPNIVVQVKYLEKNPGELRHASFQRIRLDKKALERH